MMPFNKDTTPVAITIPVAKSKHLNSIPTVIFCVFNSSLSYSFGIDLEKTIKTIAIEKLIVIVAAIPLSDNNHILY